MSNYREQMREYLKEPNEYSNQYGKWGALNIEQRQLINRLLNEMDNADAVIKKQYEEKQQLISFVRDKTQENIDKNKRTNFDLDIVYTGKISSLQEVLDFVNKGGKDE